MTLSSEKLLAENKRLKKLVETHEKYKNDFEVLVRFKLEQTIHMYDQCHKDIMQYLVDNYMVCEGDEHYQAIERLFPIPLKN